MNDTQKVWIASISGIIMQYIEVLGAIVSFLGGLAALCYTLYKFYVLYKEQVNKNDAN